ncbi:hypothetical protein D0Y65_045681 [Glycine soja]|uniref:DET1- and DDB1-associated protein 1 domain-containing protein n=1 Tax=Glycine soja TaxID=3848 RepID=A0A445G659_GLYSO|nr:hypothetical protein D0Y65_045681 [Glycine soja]
MDAPNPSSSGASPFLANLPSRGLFSSTVVSSNPGGMRVYVCNHDTSPPGLRILYLVVFQHAVATCKAYCNSFKYLC